MHENEVTLTGVLAQVDALRHTPAGLPLLHFRLAHSSQQVEAGHRRAVELEVPCVAMAEVATQLARQEPGARLRVSGFLNRRNRMSAQLVLHATQTELLKDSKYGHDEPSRPR